MKLNNKVINNVIASGTTNVTIPTEAQNKEGLEYRSQTISSIPNGFFYNLSEAIQYLQFTTGLYSASAEYEEGNICKLLYKDSSGYQLKSFRRNNKNASVKVGNAPYKPATIETVNGVDCYSEGTANSDWDEILAGLSSYIFLIENKTIDDLLDNNYTKDTIATFISKEKFNELYEACQNFKQVYFLDCFVSYKNCGEYSEGASETGDLKNFKFIELNIVKDGAVNIRFDYNLTDDAYKTYYSQGIVASGNNMLDIQAISSDLTVSSDLDKSKVVPNMLAIEKINKDIQIIEESSMKELYIDLDLSLESNVEQTINLLDKVQEINPNAKKVNFWELKSWKSARQKRLEKDGWEEEYLLANSGNPALAQEEGELTYSNQRWCSAMFLEGSFYAFAHLLFDRTSALSNNINVLVKALQKTKEVYEGAFANESAYHLGEYLIQAYASATASATASANAYANANASASANAYANAKAYAYASATAYANANASASANATASANANANASASANANANANAYAYASATASANAYAYAKKNGICYNYLNNITSNTTRKQLANENQICQMIGNKGGNYIDKDYTTNQTQIYYSQTKTKVPIVVYSDELKLKYIYKNKTDDSWNWIEEYDNGDIWLFKPVLLVNYQ